MELRESTFSILFSFQGNFVRIIDKFSHFPIYIAYNPRGTILACACDDNHIHFYSVYSRTLVKSIYAHSNTISSLEFDKTGHFLLSSSVDGYWYHLNQIFKIVVSGSVKVVIVFNPSVCPKKPFHCKSCMGVSLIVCVLPIRRTISTSYCLMQMV